jgi:hypothetical protein
MYHPIAELTYHLSQNSTPIAGFSPSKYQSGNNYFITWLCASRCKFTGAFESKFYSKSILRGQSLKVGKLLQKVAMCQKRKFTEIRLNRRFSLKADIDKHQHITALEKFETFTHCQNVKKTRITLHFTILLVTSVQNTTMWPKLVGHYTSFIASTLSILLACIFLELVAHSLKIL